MDTVSFAFGFVLAVLLHYLGYLDQLLKEVGIRRK